MIDAEKVIMKIEFLDEKYRELIAVLRENEDEQGISSITEFEIAKTLGAPQKVISKRIKRFADFGVIEQINSSSYRIIQPDILSTPLGRVGELLNVIHSSSNLSYQQQAEMLGLSMSELEIVYSYLVSIIH